MGLVQKSNSVGKGELYTFQTIKEKKIRYAERQQRGAEGRRMPGNVQLLGVRGWLESLGSPRLLRWGRLLEVNVWDLSQDAQQWGYGT